MKHVEIWVTYERDEGEEREEKRGVGGEINDDDEVLIENGNYNYLFACRIHAGKGARVQRIE